MLGHEPIFRLNQLIAYLHFDIPIAAKLSYEGFNCMEESINKVYKSDCVCVCVCFLVQPTSDLLTNLGENP